MHIRPFSLCRSADKTRAEKLGGFHLGGVEKAPLTRISEKWCGKCPLIPSIGRDSQSLLVSMARKQVSEASINPTYPEFIASPLGEIDAPFLNPFKSVKGFQFGPVNAITSRCNPAFFAIYSTSMFIFGALFAQA